VCISLYVCLSLRLYVCVYLSVCLSISSSVCLCLSRCMSVSLFVSMSVCLSVCLSISSSVCLCISLYVCVYFSVCLCTQSSAKGSLLVEMVCEHINLMEKDYFSCSYVAEDGVKVTSCSLSLIVPYRCRHFIYKLNCYT